MPPADNTRYLLDATRRRSADARRRAEDVLAQAARGDTTGRVTVVGIAKAANVSRAWLYTQTDLIDTITRLQQRHDQRLPAPARTGQQPATVASLQNRLDTANHRNKQLRSQVAELTERIEAAYGEIRALRNALPQQPTENIATMPSMTLDAGDAAELAELLQFLRDWLTSDHDHLAPALETFVGTCGYDLRQLRADLDRFTFLLGGNDGETLFQAEPR